MGHTAKPGSTSVAIVLGSGHNNAVEARGVPYHGATGGWPSSRHRGGRHARLDPEFLEDMFQMLLHGTRARAQDERDTRHTQAMDV